MVAGEVSRRDASVLVVGAGGLGTAAILGLARAGIGRLTVIDPDRVEESNLHRQLFFVDDDLGRSKAVVAKERLAKHFPALEVRAIADRLDTKNARSHLASHDVTIDGTDDPETKFVLSDAAVASRSRLVTASAVGWRGHLLTIVPGDGPCLRCLFEDPPSPEEAPGCAVAGVLGPVPGVLGALEAVEALKLVDGRGGTLLGHLLLYEGITGTFRIVEFEPRPDCSACGDDSGGAT